MGNINIIHTGYYGMQNFGDDLFVVAAVKGTEKYWKEYNNISIMGSEINDINANYINSKYMYLNSAVGKVLRAWEMIRAYKKNDLVVMSGGSTISSDSSYRMRILQERLNNIYNTKQAAIGVSIGPFNTSDDEAKAKVFLNKFEYISVRDRESLETLKRMNIKGKYILGKDLAGLIPLFYPLKEKTLSAKKTVGVSLCPYESRHGMSILDEKNRNESIAKGIVKYSLKDPNIKVKILVLNNNENNGDIEVSNELAKRLEQHNIEYEVYSHGNDPMKTWYEIGDCSALLTVRLHGGIAAYLQNTPFSLIEYHRKCTDFLNDINQSEKLRLNREINDENIVCQTIEELFNNNKNALMVDYQNYSKETLKTFTEAPWVF